MNAEIDINNIDNINKNKKKNKKHSPGLIAGMIIIVLMIVLLITLAMFMSYDEVTNVFIAGKLDIVLTEDEWDKLPPDEKENIVPNAELPKDPKITNKEVDADVFLEVTVPYVTVKLDDNDTYKGKLLTSSVQSWTGSDGAKYVDVPLYKFMVKGGNAENPTYSYDAVYSSPAQRVNPGWYLMGSDSSSTNYTFTEKNTSNKTYTYRYAYVRDAGSDGIVMEPLLQGASTRNTLFDKIKLINFREDDEGTGDGKFKFERNRDYSIKVQAYGIQAYFLAENNTTKTDPYEVWQVLQNTMH